MGNWTSNQQSYETLQKAYASQDLELALSTMTADVTWDIKGPPEIPYCGVFYGHDGFSTFWWLLNQTIAFEGAGVSKYLMDEHTIVALGGEYGHVKATQKAYHYDWAVKYDFTPDHLICSIHQYFNPERVLAALK